MTDRTRVTDVDVLRRLLTQDPELSDLVSSLDQIPVEVDEIWKKDYQPWFTDHGPRHSRRVAAYALGLTALPNLHPGLRLTPLEAFVVWAAAWLHDIGMQDLTAGGVLGDLDKEGYARIRHQHPHMSSENILASWGELGLPGDDHVLAEVVAGVARAHGTEFYRETVAERLDDVMTVRNQPVRGRLLAAILLFADELDLHYQRTERLPGWAANNPISEAHAFKHKSVRAVRTVCSTDGQISVELELDLPGGLSQQDAAAVQRWVEMKLRHQMGMVEPEIVTGLASQARFNRMIRTTVRISSANVGPPSADALAFIRAEAAQDDLVNHRSELLEATGHVETDETILLTPTEVADPPESDNDARSDLLSVLCARAEAIGRAVALSRRPALTLGATASDVLSEWSLALNGAPTGRFETEVARRTAALSDLTELMSSADGTAFLFAVDRAEFIDAGSFDWLVGTALPALRAIASVSVVMTGTTAQRRSDLGMIDVPLGTTDRDAAVAYLGRYTTQPVANAEVGAAASYRAVKVLAQGHELEMRGGHTDGTT